VYFRICIRLTFLLHQPFEVGVGLGPRVPEFDTKALQRAKLRSGEERQHRDQHRDDEGWHLAAETHADGADGACEDDSENRKVLSCSEVDGALRGCEGKLDLLQSERNRVVHGAAMRV